MIPLELGSALQLTMQHLQPLMETVMAPLLMAPLMEPLMEGQQVMGKEEEMGKEKAIEEVDGDMDEEEDGVGAPHMEEEEQEDGSDMEEVGMEMDVGMDLEQVGMEMDVVMDLEEVGRLMDVGMDLEEDGMQKQPRREEGVEEAAKESQKGLQQAEVVTTSMEAS